ncbi:MAG: hypothetical protein K2Q14_04075 [Gammaproteobacteria bacterium]|nr:hypothetical protein [Gammaproteobacteria bacterium]
MNRTSAQKGVIPRRQPNEFLLCESLPIAAFAQDDAVGVACLPNKARTF